VDKSDFIYKIVMLEELDPGKWTFDDWEGEEIDEGRKLDVRTHKEEGKKYDWKSLEESIQKHGLIEPLHVTQKRFVCNYFYKYKIRDGKHRIKILRKLHPPNYKIKVKVFNK